jgi:lysyl-tRNA synthetase class 2
VQWRPLATRAALEGRARLLGEVRAFFRERGVLEVETPILQGGANLDPGSQSHPVPCGAELRFLPTSPEHPLKRLVAAGYGPVWTLAPVVRLGEHSRRHQPEFRMLEWYRPLWDERQLLDEVVALLDRLTGWGRRCERISYRAAFARWCDGLDPEQADAAAFARLLPASEAPYAGDRQAAADLLLSARIEPQLGRGSLSALVDYPPHLAAQAELRLDADGRQVAARFEVYRDGIELANGYRELTDAAELSERLYAQLASRQDSMLQRDARFEAAMAAGLPPCAGVALGFDRVVMLALGLESVAAGMAFPWELA